MKKYKQGQKVAWVSQAGGIETLKSGIIVEVVPPNKHPKNIPIIAHPYWDKSSSMNSYEESLPRSEESYLVSVGGLVGRPKLYWPRTSSIIKYEEEIEECYIEWFSENKNRA